MTGFASEHRIAAAAEVSASLAYMSQQSRVCTIPAEKRVGRERTFHSMRTYRVRADRSNVSLMTRN